MRSPIRLIKAILADVKFALPDVKGLDRDLVTIEGRYKNEGVQFLTVTLPSYFEAVLMGLEVGKFTCGRAFRKASKSSKIPALFQGILCNVFDPSTGLEKSDSATYLSVLYQVCYFFKKALIASDEENLDRSAKNAFYSCDRAVVEEIPQHLSSRIRIVGSYTLRSLVDIYYQPDFYEGRHGPGAVVEKVYGNRKWTALGRLVRAGRNLLPESGLDLLYLDEFLDNHTPVIDDYSSPSARLVTVPKNSRSRRTITVEPLMNQFYQQALNKSLRDSITKCRVLSKCLTLNSQRPNQELAIYGSLNRSVATIDLSSASDLLGISLVREVFHHHEVFLDLMMRTRSKLDQIDLRKYAGMGNATTFPVQSICFATLSIVAVCDAANLPLTEKNIVACAKKVRVFGDDIIIPTSAYHVLAKILSDCGLVINKKKSYKDGFFRESCGVDAYHGINITPIYMRIDPRLTSLEDSQIETICSTSNQLFRAGYYRTARALKDMVPGGKVLPSSGVPGAIGFDFDGYPVTRMCKRTHQPLARVTVSKVSFKRDILNGVDALCKFFHTPLIERCKGHLQRSPVRYQNKIVARWMPVRTGPV